MPFKKKNKQAKCSSVCLLRPHKTRGSPSSLPPSSTSPKSFPPHPLSSVGYFFPSSCFRTWALAFCSAFAMGSWKKKLFLNFAALGARSSQKETVPLLLSLLGFSSAFVSTCNYFVFSTKMLTPLQQNLVAVAHPLASVDRTASEQ